MFISDFLVINLYIGNSVFISLYFAIVVIVWILRLLTVSTFYNYWWTGSFWNRNEFVCLKPMWYGDKDKEICYQQRRKLLNGSKAQNKDGKVFNGWNALNMERSLDHSNNQDKTFRSLIFLIFLYGAEIWTPQKAERGIDTLDCGGGCFAFQDKYFHALWTENLNQASFHLSNANNRFARAHTHTYAHKEAKIFGKQQRTVTAWQWQARRHAFARFWCDKRRWTPLKSGVWRRCPHSVDGVQDFYSRMKIVS